MQKRLAEQKDMNRREKADFTSEMAKMRFTVNLDRARKTEQETLMAEKLIREAKKRKQDADDNLRHTKLVNATKTNFQIEKQMKVTKKQQR